MKRLWTLGIVLTSLTSWSQSYDSMESRFNRSVPTAQDSVAYINQGEQKVRSLFDLTNLYNSNSGRSSNQSYIQRAMPEFFYVEEGENLNLPQVMNTIESARPSGESVQTETMPAEGKLARVITINTNPPLAFDLVLKRVPKQFGKQQELVWEVLVAVPVEWKVD